MAVIFESTIKIDETGDWYIQLIDKTDGRIMLCNDVEAYEKNVEELGQDYGGHIDEVVWLKDENVEQYIIDEIQLEMEKYKDILEKEE